MFARLKKFWKKRKEKGSVLVATALMLPVMLAFVGIAFDIGRLYVEKTKFQNWADAAALAGLSEIKQHQYYKLNSGKLVRSIPIGALPFTFDDDNRNLRQQADTKADDWLMRNTGDSYFQLENAGAKSELYFMRNSDEDAPSSTYYYEIILERTYPLTFGRIVYGKDITVRAGAVCVFDLVNPANIYTYDYALQNWSRLTHEELMQIDSARRLKVDREAITKLATVLLGKDSTWLNANLGSDANTTDCLYGWYDKEKVVDGNLFTQYRVNNTTQGKTLGDKLIALMRGEDAAQGFNYDNTQRYLFSDYATTHEDGFKITLQKNSQGLVSKVKIRINPGDTANGSGALHVELP